MGVYLDLVHGSFKVKYQYWPLKAIQSLSENKRGKNPSGQLFDMIF